MPEGFHYKTMYVYINFEKEEEENDLKWLSNILKNTGSDSEKKDYYL